MADPFLSNKKQQTRRSREAQRTPWQGIFPAWNVGLKQGG